MSRPSPHPSQAPRPAGRGATRLESVEEIRQAGKVQRIPTVKEAVAVPDADTVAFRPQRRPPMALLCILDDGRDDGEWVRLRGDRAVIGRGEADIVIPHDSMISGRHAELTRELVDGRHRWYLTDLGSTNGTYVRVGSALLSHNQELLLGSCRYRFDAAPQGAPASTGEETGEQPRSTSRWTGVSSAELFPALVELTAQGEGRRFALTGAEALIGRRPGPGGVVLAEDPLLSERHARLYADRKGRWHIENSSSLNGTWLRIERMALEPAGQFQLGEQRFLLRVL